MFDQAEQWIEAYDDLTGNMLHQKLLACAALRLRQGRLDEALAHYESCLELQATERVRGEADALEGIGRVLRILRNGSEGIAFHRDAELMRRRHANPFELAKTLCFLSEAYQELRDLPQAAQARDEALELLLPFHDRKADELRQTLRRSS